MRFFGFYKNIFKNERGFTLFELLVVIVIIAIFSGIIFASPNDWQKTLALERSAQKLSQDISQSRSLSMKGHSGLCFSGDPNGYGIYLDKADQSKYFIYMNCSADASKSYSPSFDQKFEDTDINLESNIIICGLEAEGVEQSSLSIFFDPPDPSIVINNIPRATSSVSICVKGDDSKKKTIEINRAGSINLK